MLDKLSMSREVVKITKYLPTLELLPIANCYDPTTVVLRNISLLKQEG